MVAKPRPIQIARLVHYLSVEWAVAEEDLRSHFDDSVSLELWQLLAKWHDDYPTMTFRTSLALFEAKAAQRRRGHGDVKGLSRTRTWQPWDINASRRGLELAYSTVSLKFLRIGFKVRC